MSKNDEPSSGERAPRTAEERIVYLLPQDESNARFDLDDVLRELWKGRVLVLVSILVAGAVGFGYAMLATPWYRAEVVMLPTETDLGQGLASQLSQLGPLASLAGVTIGNGHKAEPLAVLQSRSFSRSFIEENGLMQVLFADEWDSAGKTWKDDADPPPDIRDAVEYFHKDVRKVLEDRKTGIVRLSIEWKDAAVASAWANSLAQRLNSQMRDRALADAARNIRFLREELAATNVVSLQQSIGRLLEAELQKLMLARGNEEFAFRVVDVAEVPKKRARPRRAIILAGSLIVGALFGAGMALFRSRHKLGMKGTR